MTNIFDWFLSVLEKMATSQGVRALATPFTTRALVVRQEDE